MKLGLGLVVAVTAALAALLAAGAAAEEPRKPPEKAQPADAKKAKFDTPVWHPDAEWESAGFLGFSGAATRMEGPRLETGNGGPRLEPLLFIGTNKAGGIHAGADPRYGFCPALPGDDHADRIHAAAGLASGYLDGPFSRARFGMSGYGARPAEALSPDGRYFFRTEPSTDMALRQFDYAKQMVRTITPPALRLSAWRPRKRRSTPSMPTPAPCSCWTSTARSRRRSRSRPSPGRKTGTPAPGTSTCSSTRPRAASTAPGRTPTSPTTSGTGT